MNTLIYCFFSSVWYGVIFVRQGLYSGGIFRFSISLPDQFPSDTEVPVRQLLHVRTHKRSNCSPYPKTVIFETIVPHPLICSYTQRLDISEALTIWTEGESHLWQLLKFIQFAFEQARACARGKVSNAEAADQLLHQPDVFRDEVREAVRLARDAVHDPPKSEDKHYITFERFESDVHGATLESIRTRQDASLSPNASGVSWLM